MTLYCYRCGNPIEVKPRVRALAVFRDNTVKITFDDELVQHTCRPSPTDRPL